MRAQVAGTQEIRDPLRIFVVAGDHSGDPLGSELMAAVTEQSKQSGHPPPVFAGLGGAAMTERGLTSLFPLDDVVVMGPLAIAKAYPRLRRRVFEVIAAAIAFAPDVVVVIDAPEFTHPIAKRIRKRLPGVPIIDYVSPSVWAWRPGRAARMRAYIDHVLALLPFEPEVHRRLGGPPCTYVGHPLIERASWIAAQDPDALAERLGLPDGQPVLVVLPGSRASEVRRLLQPFGEAVARLHQTRPPFQVLIPTVAARRADIEAQCAGWPVRPVLIEGEADKFAAFRLARAALTKSGTVTLELALAGTPMVVAYKVEPVATLLRFLVKVPSIVLANLVLGENVFPELIQEDCTPEKLAAAMTAILDDTPVRSRQLAGLAQIKSRMGLALDGSLPTRPSHAAASIVLAAARHLDATLPRPS